MPHITAFDGGLSLRVDPSLLKSNEAQHLKNVDPNPIVLKSTTDFASTSISIGSYAKYFGDVWLSSSNPRQYIEYENVLYYTEENKFAGYYSNGNARTLGIERPDKITSELRGVGSDILIGVFTYTLTYYNSDNGFESANSEYSEKFTVTEGNYVSFSDLPVSIDPKVTHKRLYMLGGSFETPVLVAEIANSVIHTTNTPTDDIQNVRLLQTFKNYPPDLGMQFLVEAYGIFFGLVGSEVRFSDLDKPNAWPKENVFKLRGIGTGLLVIPQGILIFTQNLTYLLVGTNIKSFSLMLVSEYQGCINGDACSVVRNAPLWVSYDGICTIQNGYVQVISRMLLGKTTLDVKQSVVYDEQYFLLRQDGSILVLDIRNGFRFYELLFTEKVDGLTVSKGVLYFISRGVLNEAFIGDPLEFEYTSPVFTDGDHTEIKKYNKVFIRANGDFIVKLYIDENLALTKSISGNKTFDLTPPTNKQSGYNFYVNITGIGTVYSIRAKPLGTQYGN